MLSLVTRDHSLVKKKVKWKGVKFLREGGVVGKGCVGEGWAGERGQGSAQKDRV